MKNKVKAVIFAVITFSVIFGAAVFELPSSSNLLSITTLANKNSERITLSPSGKAFGVKYFTKGALIVGLTDIETAQGLSSPARDAGLEVKDIIINVGGKEIKSAEDFQSVVANSGGNGIEIKYVREGSEKNINVTPVIDKTDNTYKLGIWVRDSTAGIGTITYINNDTGEFGGLGHGICDSETGILLPLDRGIIVDVTITDIVMGKKNAPGELKGKFDRYRKGELNKNTEVGVFGKFDNYKSENNQEFPIGFKDELKVGKAYILTTLDNGKPEQFEIEIEKIYNDSGSTKNFMIKITDSKLLVKTGGIIQGMSGSPIIQDGKLFGAVTHVLVGDSTRGYGIHIENMIDGMSD
ncbi:MAG: SpoIVB peptidase [Clostridiales bacterium GWF2_36_10]|nr:MAG: SpoIVB peptidase [Clostridiales bacterium GWF2_36_10]